MPWGRVVATLGHSFLFSMALIAQGFFLKFDEFEDPFLAEGEHAAEGVRAEGVGFGGALDFDEFAAGGHDDVHIGLGG